VSNIEKTLQAALQGASLGAEIEALRASRPPTRITEPKTLWLLRTLVQRLAPADCLEIGSLFADTSRVLADALVDAGGGSLVTIDPYGGDRVPEIIEAWPALQRATTRFLPVNSMSFFLDLETSRTPRGLAAPFNLAFVDGHHSFEYAYFDLLRTAHYLRPGGAIVVDNTEQSGPAQAVRAFLAEYRQWTEFVQQGYIPPDDRPEFMPGAGGALLLAPPGLEIGSLPFKFNLYDIGQSTISAIELQTLGGECTGTLLAAANLYSLPYDYHLTGSGLVYENRAVRQAIRGFEAGKTCIPFDPPLRIEPTDPDKSPTHLELELRFISDEGPHLLLDPEAAVVLRR